MKYPDSKTRKLYGKQGLLSDLRKLRFVERNMPENINAKKEIMAKIEVVKDRIANL